MSAATYDEVALEVACRLCSRFEGCILSPYLCPAGVPTIGYGTTVYPNGVAVQLTDPAITKEHARSLLLWWIKNKCMPVALRLCPGIDSPNRLAAISDFLYNLGRGALQSSTLRKRINEGRWEEVPTELRKWINAAGRPMRGLIFRREAEAQLI